MSRRIVIIDDDNFMLTMMTHYLTDVGYEVFSAGNGTEGLKTCAKIRPALVVTDIIMPESDGLEVIRSLRAQGSSCAILAVSGSGTHDRIDWLRMARSLGAHAALRKPLVRDDLVDTVHGLLDQRPRC